MITVRSLLLFFPDEAQQSNKILLAQNFTFSDSLGWDDAVEALTTSPGTPRWALIHLTFSRGLIAIHSLNEHSMLIMAGNVKSAFKGEDPPPSNCFAFSMKIYACVSRRGCEQCDGTVDMYDLKPDEVKLLFVCSWHLTWTCRASKHTRLTSHTPTLPF